MMRFHCEIDWARIRSENINIGPAHSCASPTHVVLRRTFPLIHKSNYCAVARQPELSKVKRRLVPGDGVEPSQYCYRGILSPLCLPIPPPGQIEYRISNKECRFQNCDSIFSNYQKGSCVPCVYPAWLSEKGMAFPPPGPKTTTISYKL